MASASLTRSVSMFGSGGGGARTRGDHHAAGYLGPKSLDRIVSAVTDPDDDDDDEEDDDLALNDPKRDNDGVSRLFGGAWENPEGVERIEGAFSALTPSMWPENTEHKEGFQLNGRKFEKLGLNPGPDKKVVVSRLCEIVFWLFFRFTQPRDHSLAGT